MANPTQATPVTLTLPTHELAQLTRGLAYLFWGQLALWATGLELVLNSAEWLTALLGLFGTAGLVVGSWALTQAPTIGPAWRRQAGNLLVLGVLVAYLGPFAWMWQQVPESGYFLAHALAWWWMLIAYLVVLSACLRTLARALGDQGLAWQMTGIGAAAYIVLVGPYSIAALALTEIVLRDGDALAGARFLLSHLHPVAVFVLLSPLVLSLSLVWSVKDWAFRRLTTPAPNSIVPPTQP